MPSRPVWDPRSARNLDLEMERSGNRAPNRMYSDHDDRRSPEVQRRPGGAPGARGASPDSWKHDLWESVKDAPKKEPEAPRRETKPAGETAIIAVGLRVRNFKTNRKGTVSEVEEGSESFHVKFDDGDQH